jgi:hypothetical protein
MWRTYRIFTNFLLKFRFRNTTDVCGGNFPGAIPEIRQTLMSQAAVTEHPVWAERGV